MPQKVLITGGSGAVGSAVVARMLERPGEFEPVVFDLTRATNALAGGEPWPAGSNVMSIIGDISSFEDVRTAMTGCDAVIHLANGGSEWEDNLKYNLVGTYNIFENAAQLGVTRVATASRAGVTGQPNDGPGSPYPDDFTKTVDLPYKPTGHYTISKVFHEAMGYSYAHEHGMGVVACRIGNFNRTRDEPTHPHELGWHDCGEVFCQAIAHPLPPVVHPGGRTTHGEKEVFYHAVFAVSDSTWPMYDLEHGKRVIGYHPTQKSIVPAEKWQGSKL
jgi:nucleoside-diphosphate-sugar epimerase